VETGTYISGLGHVAVLGWAILGGVLNSATETPEFQVTDISVVSEAAFAALISDAPRPISEVQQPLTPLANEATPDAPSADNLPRLTTVTEPDAPQDAGISPDLAAVTLVPETSAQIEAPEFGDQPTTDQQGATLIVPTAPLADQDRGGLQQPDQLAILTPEPPAPRVDITPAPKPPTDADKAPEVEKATTPDGDTTKPAEEATEKAPDQASTEIVTEAKESDSKLAPTRTSRPKGRPAKLAEKSSGASAIEQALAQAQTEASNQSRTTPPPTPTGPPLTEVEREGLRLAVRECWNVNPSSEAARITVTVALSMERNGKPVAFSIRLLTASEGAQSSVRAAFEAASRAIQRCGNSGYDLPAEKYDRWRDIEITFNPEKMRRK
jgi:hypothetical protein